MKDILDNIEPATNIDELPHSYPGFLERVKAVITDSIVIVCFMIIIGVIFSTIENVPDQARMIAFVFVFGLYDPIFTSLFGGTIGHMIIGIRVKRDDGSNKKILFPFAIIRYIIKALLGWISLATINRNDKGKAIHDIIVNSVVVYK